MTVDVGNSSNVQVGDEVTVIGQGGQEEITVQELAHKAETIVDEICFPSLTLSNPKPLVSLRQKP